MPVRTGQALQRPQRRAGVHTAGVGGVGGQRQAGNIDDLDMEVLRHENVELKQRLSELELQFGGGVLPGAMPLAEDKHSIPMISVVPAPPTTVVTTATDKARSSFADHPELLRTDPELLHTESLSDSSTPGKMLLSSAGITKVGHRTLQAKVRAHASSIGRAGFEDDQSLAISKMGLLKGDPFAHEEEDKKKFRNLGETMTFLLNTHAQGDAIQRFASGIVFKTFSMTVILANTLYLGAAADFNVKNSYRRLQGMPKEEEWTVVTVVFTVWFVIELVVRMAAERVEFFRGDEMWWNYFDGALVAESVASFFLISGSFSFLRILRVFRLVRIVRLVRTVEALKKLRTMIFAILNSFADLLWALLVVSLICFVFSIVFNNAVAYYFDEVNLSNSKEMADAQEVEVEFGSLYKSMNALWSAVSGGNDWMYYGGLLRKINDGELYFQIFVFYVAFCVVGMFNVVTGVFVDSAVCTRTQDEIVQGYLDDLKTMTAAIKEFLRDADKDRSGSLSYDEFQKHMHDPHVKAYFNGIDIDPDEAKVIFTLLDSDNSGDVEIEELVNGTMKLKGYATKLDMMALMYDCTRQSMKLDSLCDFVEAQFDGFKHLMTSVAQLQQLAVSGPQKFCPGGDAREKQVPEPGQNP